VHATAEFYATRQGAIVARLLRERLGLLWPSLRGQTVLGIGYAAPFLRLWREEAGHCVSLTPAQIGAARWPPGAASLSCVAEEDALPFADLSIDRVLIIHGLESAENARRLLREAWRVLKDDGRLLIVTPNRPSLWALIEATPFGQGQPYSARQIGRLLAAALFRVERRDSALYLPPTRLRLLLRTAKLWERTGRALLPRLGGVTLTEASKDLYAAVPAKRAPRRRIVFVEAA
jgi:SAM-dependent methyltransferase